MRPAECAATAAIVCATRSSPSMTGTIGCSPGTIANPASVIAARNQRVLAASRSRRSPSKASSSRHASEAHTIAGASVFENRYGRARWRISSTISARPDTYPPDAPPSALPRVPVITSTLSATPNSSGVPPPVGPTKPTACESSTITSASYRSANAQISSSGATYPSIENTPSVAISRYRASAASLSRASRSAMSRFLYR